MKIRVDMRLSFSYDRCRQVFDIDMTKAHSNSVRLVPGSPQTTFFATRELGAFYEENGWPVRGFQDSFYVNSLDTIPKHFLVLEVAFVGLSLGLLFHSIRNQISYLWFGFFGFGLVSEIIGFLLKTHYHGQFYLHIFTFLPLKEVAWYPVFMYPSYVSASRFKFKSVWGQAALYGLLVLFSDVTYEVCNGRTGVHVVFINPSSPAAALNEANRFLDVSLYICYSISLLATVHALIIEYAIENNYSFALKVIAIIFAFPIQLIFFVPIWLAQQSLCFGEQCPHDSYLRPGALWALIAVIQVLAVLSSIKQTERPQTLSFSSLCIAPLTCNAVFCYFLLVAENESKQDLFDAGTSIFVATLFICGVHILATKYSDSELLLERKLKVS